MFTLTSKNFIWTAQKNKSDDLSRTVIVDLNIKDFQSIDQYFGICTDYPGEKDVRNSL